MAEISLIGRSLLMMYLKISPVAPKGGSISASAPSGKSTPCSRLEAYCSQKSLLHRLQIKRLPLINRTRKLIELQLFLEWCSFPSLKEGNGVSQLLNHSYLAMDEEFRFLYWLLQKNLN